MNYIDRELDFAAAATFGGATSCVEIECGDDAFFLCDMGSGLQHFGRDAAALCRRGRRAKFNVFLSHMHWDHIMGFPSFLPAFDDATTIVIHSCHDDAENALRRQHDEVSHPVPFDSLAAQISFVTMIPGQPFEVDGMKVTAMQQDHPHASFGYCFTDSVDRRIVYSTDSEHRIDNMDREDAFAAFFRDAELVICDTMYSLAATNSSQEDWGHSSNIVAIDLCRLAGAKRLALFHHDPFHSDDEIQRMHDDSIRYEELTRVGAPLEVLCAYDGLEIAL
ncbi:MBL fold metallo-hydrolase [Sphingomonas lutea]|uniref:MBL fold metallo-hydrolase n=1 Tax=Sphingomonas lutea TaxID=1045317 RepID=UPI001F1CF274|nr:MBL fold metallo-hydrolase [Sphingomonas lutea]